MRAKFDVGAKPIFFLGTASGQQLSTVGTHALPKCKCCRKSIVLKSVEPDANFINLYVYNYRCKG